MWGRGVERRASLWGRARSTQGRAPISLSLSLSLCAVPREDTPIPPFSLSLSRSLSHLQQCPIGHSPTPAPHLIFIPFFRASTANLLG